MAEMLLHYLWEHRLWEYGTLTTDDGDRVDVLDPGIHNTNSGPDFFNAKIKIGDRMWVGNVEIHVRASDWFRHGHHQDTAYDNVILHIVGSSDQVVKRRNGSIIPQAVMLYNTDFSQRYDEMVNGSDQPACSRELADIKPIHITDWISALGYERIYSKSDRILNYLERLDGDWQSTAYVTLARALGFSVNSDPFEQLAFATPLRCLLKHRSQPELVEATLFGQAGLLEAISIDDDNEQYVDRLKQNYAFMQAKYGLQPINGSCWKLSRMRPPNFPHRRIAILAGMIADGFAFGRAFTHVTDQKSARSLFDLNLNDYWQSHFNFVGTAARITRAFSPDTVTSLIINAVVPLMYAYGLFFANDSRIQIAVDILQSLPPERNSLTRIFTDRFFECDDAFTSQALIQLRRAYCEPRKCLFCRIGHRILASKATPLEE